MEIELRKADLCHIFTPKSPKAGYGTNITGKESRARTMWFAVTCPAEVTCPIEPAVTQQVSPILPAPRQCFSTSVLSYEKKKLYEYKHSHVRQVTGDREATEQVLVC